MKRHSLLCLSVLAIAACAESPTSLPFDAALGKAPSGPANASAGVTLLPSTTDAATSIIVSGDDAGEYRDGRCGITATVFYAGSNDLIMSTGNPAAKDRKCTLQPGATYPRRISVRVNGQSYAAVGFNVLSAGSLIAGTTDARQVGIPLAAGAPCARIQFNLAEGGLPVSRQSATNYSVSGSGTARCVQDDGSFTLLPGLAVSATFRSY